MAKTSLNLPDDFIALDLETTGLDANRCEIIEVAVVKIKGLEIVDSYSTLVRPSSPIPEFVSELTGITDDMVASAPDIKLVLPSIAEMLNGHTVVGHNVCFDDRFIQKAAMDSGITCEYTLFDTLRCSRHVLKNLESRKLDSVAESCNVYVDSIDRHRALYDATIAALCAISMRPGLEKLYGDDPDSALRSRSYGAWGESIAGAIKPTVEAIDESNPFYGANITFTGKLSSMNRDEAVQRAVNLGAIPLSNFTKKTDYLVVGSFDFSANIRGEKSTKLRKAEKAIAQGSSVQIVSEEFFLDFAKEV